MQRYDAIVVGSGISGLTMALLLAKHGQKVLVVEKGPAAGGSMSRFYLEGIPFDTGFHFTGGLRPGELLLQMLAVLGIEDSIRPIYAGPGSVTRFVFEDDGATIDLPLGIEAGTDRLKGFFPEAKTALDRYFEMLRSVCAHTPSMDLRKLNLPPVLLDEDFVSLQTVLDNLTSDRRLQTILASTCLCYGVKPDQVSFANHCRMSLFLHESLARVENGGDAFVTAIKDRLDAFGVEFRYKCEIASLGEIRDRRVGRFVLSDGDEVSADHCVFTIHPWEILKLVPRENVRKAFIDRVAGYESSVGFFSLFATMEPLCTTPGFDGIITTAFPSADLNGLLDPANTADGPLVLMTHVDKALDGTRHRIASVLETSCPSEVERWRDSSVGKRPPEYGIYKQRKTERICERVRKLQPPEEGVLKIYDTASVLTYRDYLNSPDGSAYGIKQKLGQHNTMGILPLRNLHAAGQSALLPGLIGAMVSSFMVAREVILPERHASLEVG